MGYPNFFIVGAAKCGTTSLYEYLKLHPDIFMSEEKEPCYFSTHFMPESPVVVKTDKKYCALFKNVKNEIAIGEASAPYLQDKKTPELIKKAVPDAKIIILLRSPTERSFSHYLKNSRLDDSSLETIINNDLKKINNGIHETGVLSSSFYDEGVNRYYKHFGKENVLVLIFEEFFKDINKNIINVLDFLGVEKSLTIPDKAFNIHHTPRVFWLWKLSIKESFRKLVRPFLPMSVRKWIYTKLLVKGFSKPSMPTKEKLILKDIFTKDMENLEKTLGRKLPW